MLPTWVPPLEPYPEAAVGAVLDGSTVDCIVSLKLRGNLPRPRSTGRGGGHGDGRGGGGRGGGLRTCIDAFLNNHLVTGEISQTKKKRCSLQGEIARLKENDSQQIRFWGTREPPIFGIWDLEKVPRSLKCADAIRILIGLLGWYCCCCCNFAMFSLCSEH